MLPVMAPPALGRYHAKRRFTKTPEPKGLAFATSQQRFVVQKHHATQLHYDFRLEHKGVMLSWAVPKGPSDNPAEKHLAAHTEDHPLEYRHFEGIIPEGYGAGTVMIWDNGTFEWVRRGKDHYSFILHGQKMRGEYALVRLQRAGPKAWLMLKKKDRYARTGKALINRAPNSVITGRSLEEIKKGAPVKAAFIKKLPAARRAALPRSRFVTPMKPTLITKAFSDPEWIYEMKWDGFRGIAAIDSKKVTLKSRNEKDLFEYFPELKNIDDAFAARSVIIDGEAVSLDKKGVSRFSGLGLEERARNMRFEVFDLLYLDGFDLTGVPLEQRKALLRAITLPHDKVAYTDHIEGAGKDFFEETHKIGAEGMIAKERNSIYDPGKRTRTWYKIKHTLQQEFVIGGWAEGQGAREGTIGSLLLGVYEDGALRFSGKVGSGFHEGNLAPLLKQLRRLEQSESPFKLPAGMHRGPGSIHYVKPRLAAQVKFEEWTGEGQLRQPVFLGIRTDKPVREIVREVPHGARLAGKEKSSGTTGKKTHESTGTESTPTGKDLSARLPFTAEPNQSLTVGNQTLKFTNLKKVFWKSPRHLKRDVINYYYALAPILLPHLKDRPLSMKRYPDGAASWFFYQKNVPMPHPDFVETISVRHSQGPTRYAIVNNLETLLWAANLANLEIHPWYSRRGSLNNPDFVVFDLDPSKEDDLASIRQVALLVKEVMDHFGLESFPKSSGSRGIHVYVPIAPHFTYDQTKEFAKKVTGLIHHLAPHKTTLEFRKAKRHGVYVDYLQNIKGKTLACAYSLRARPGATVSAPLLWSEVKKGFKISDFTITSILPRLKKHGDLFGEVLTKKQDLGPALRQLRKLDL
jgi:bifunctional non-homologous end joining protein LigD